MEKLYEALGSGVGNTIGWMAEHGILLAVFGFMWAGFAAALVWNQGALDQVWASIRELPLLGQLVIWVLFLPVMVGLWVWETTWPVVVRFALVIGLAGWNLLMFLPRAAQVAKS